MKVAFYILLFITVSSPLTAQPDQRVQSICLISEIPILIESDPIIYNFDQKGNFDMGAGRIRVRQIKRSLPYEFDHLIQWNQPLPVDQQKKVNPFLQLGATTQPLIEKSNSGTNKLLVDTILKPNQKLGLLWQDLTGKTIQSITFRCAVIVPGITGMKQFKSFDSIDQGHKARQIKRIQSLPKGYQLFENEKMEVEPGNHLEIKMKTHSLLPDSSILYQLTNNKENITGKWLATGHVLTLPNLSPGEDYTLDVKYFGQEKTQSYQIISRPYWFQRLWIRIIAILLIITGTIAITRWFFKRRLNLLNSQRQRLEEQLTTIQSQLNPHFIFNALSSIEGLVTSGQNQLANGYLNTFSAIMRETLKNADKLLISLKEEIELVEKYISIEQLRFGFSYDINIDDKININELEIPPMLIQPLVENAVKHGAGSLGQKGRIKISLKRNADNMIITVINNKLSKKEVVKTAGGYGLSFTKQRLAHFNELNPKTPIRFNFIEDVEQVEVQLIFEYWLI